VPLQGKGRAHPPEHDVEIERQLLERLLQSVRVRNVEDGKVEGDLLLGGFAAREIGIGDFRLGPVGALRVKPELHVDVLEQARRDATPYEDYMPGGDQMDALAASADEDRGTVRVEPLVVDGLDHRDQRTDQLGPRLRHLSVDLGQRQDRHARLLASRPVEEIGGERAAKERGADQPERRRRRSSPFPCAHRWMPQNLRSGNSTTRNK
jgi:hypothetical protein